MINNVQEKRPTKGERPSSEMNIAERLSVALLGWQVNHMAHEHRLDVANLGNRPKNRLPRPGHELSETMSGVFLKWWEMFRQVKALSDNHTESWLYNLQFKSEFMVKSLLLFMVNHLAKQTIDQSQRNELIRLIHSFKVSPQGSETLILPITNEISLQCTVLPRTAFSPGFFPNTTSNQRYVLGHIGVIKNGKNQEIMQVDEETKRLQVEKFRTMTRFCVSLSSMTKPFIKEVYIAECKELPEFFALKKSDMNEIIDTVFADLKIDEKWQAVASQVPAEQRLDDREKHIWFFKAGDAWTFYYDPSNRDLAGVAANPNRIQKLALSSN